MGHQHTYDSQGRMTCCQKEARINQQVDAMNIKAAAKKHQEHHHEQGHEHSHDHNHEHHSEEKGFKMFIPSIISFALLLSGIALDKWIPNDWFHGWVKVVWFVLAYIQVGVPVLKEAWESILKGDWFSEFFLMGIATIGAFAIGEYPEAVTVMLFYAIGEIFQTMAVSNAKSSIKNLLDQRPDEVTLIENGQSKIIKAAEVGIGAVLQLKPGEKLALDGVLISESGSFNTAALTGESVPDTKKKGDVVLAGMINLNTVSRVEVTTVFEDSKLSKILDLVQNASAQKAPTELFIRKFARIYTPIVVGAAILICLLPYFWETHYVFKDWLYRSLIFLVISCPCALVISIPLGYFGGIGAASRNGILFKGSSFLDVIANIQHVVMDKTGTLTHGVFKVQEINLQEGFNKDEILRRVNALENLSTHPVASAIHDYVGKVDTEIIFDKTEEIAGKGLKGIYQGKELLVGNFKLLDDNKITYNVQHQEVSTTLIAIAYDKKFVGYLTIFDEIKEDASPAVRSLKATHVKTTMLSGDKQAVVEEVAKKLGIDYFFGDLLPEDKVRKVQAIKARNEIVAFVGDGVNDAPVVALSDVGIAMGGLGSDATIETADVVIQDDKPSKIAIAIKIGKATKKIVWQNIGMAFFVKLLVLILGVGGLATMWEAVFADVGVALLAILNAVRIQRMKF
ncbi:MAG TPA: heavy metal translocating P-type ATPase [Edaphocola sp.]|nr:heavy metal translocating P-type ATPase [Edaphocola sp.]